VIIDSALVTETMRHIHLPSVHEAVAEVQACVKAGVRTMVDAMPAGAGRDPERLSRVSVLTGMRIVATTGLHTEKYYVSQPSASVETPVQLAARFVADIVEGIDRHDYRVGEIERTEVRAGVIKAASMTVDLTDHDRRVFEAASIAHRETGAPILTHTEGGAGGMTQIAELIGHGVGAGQIALSHTDKIADSGYHRSMLETGVNLCYDQGLRAPEVTFSLVMDMAEEGHAHQIVLGTDGARRSLWSTLGGSPGLAALYGMARERLDAELFETVFVINPARWLSLAH
jgi:phosphotriesterase-related protein